MKLPKEADTISETDRSCADSFIFGIPDPAKGMERVRVWMPAPEPATRDRRQIK